MSDRNYWLNLFTYNTWEEFKKAGSNVSGFRESRWKTVQKIKKGDLFICYLTGISRFIGILEVTKEVFKDNSTIWADEDFPCRLGVRNVVELTTETAVPVLNLRENLTFFENLKSRNAWTGRFRGSPSKWETEDGEAVVKALIEAKEHPIERPVDKRKLARRPKSIKAKMGPVTVPDSEVLNTTNEKPLKESTEHTEVQ